MRTNEIKKWEGKIKWKNLKCETNIYIYIYIYICVCIYIIYIYNFQQFVAIRSFGDSFYYLYWKN